MKRILFFLSLSLCMLDMDANSQAKVLSVGNQCPDFRFSKILNATFQETSLNKLENKIVILDFWNTGCGVCIKKMPKIAELQAKFRDKIAVIMVSWEKKEHVKQFFQKRPELVKFQIPTVTEDKELRLHFPYSMNPHLVWIGLDRKVKAITGSEALTSQNIDKILQSGMLDLPTKIDILDFDPETEPLLSLGKQIQPSLLSSSCFTTKIQGLRAKLGFYSINESRTKVLGTNVSMLSLYAFAYIPEITLNSLDFTSRIQIKTADTSLPVTLKKQICFEMIHPLANKNENRVKVRQAMRNQLDQFLGVKSSIEKVDVQCYVLSWKDNIVKGTLAGSAEYQDFLDSTRLLNCPVEHVVGYLKDASPELNIPIVYEGPGSTTVSVTIKKQYNSIEEINKEIAKVGLELSFQIRKLDMLVIRDLAKK